MPRAQSLAIKDVHGIVDTYANIDNFDRVKFSMARSIYFMTNIGNYSVIGNYVNIDNFAENDNYANIDN